MKTAMNHNVKGIRDEKEKILQPDLLSRTKNENRICLLQSSVFNVPTDDSENPEVHVASRETIKRKHKAKKRDSVRVLMGKDTQF